MSSYVPIVIDIGTIGLNGSDGDDNRSAFDKSKNDFNQLFASLGFDSGTNEVAIGDTGASAAASHARLRLKADFSDGQSHIVMQDAASAAFHFGVEQSTNEYYVEVGNTLALSTRYYTMNSLGEFGLGRAPISGVGAAIAKGIEIIDDGTSSVITNKSFSAAGIPIWVSSLARGTEALPTAVQSGDIIARFDARSHDDGGFDADGAYHQVITTENWDATSHGMKQVWSTTPNGATAAIVRMTIAENGEKFLNLPTSAGTTGSLWNDAGTVKVA